MKVSYNFKKNNMKRIYFLFIILFLSLSLNIYFANSLISSFTEQKTIANNIVEEIQKQDSLLYKQLLILDVASLGEFQLKEDTTLNINLLSELLELETNYASQEKSLERFLSLEELRQNILRLHQLHLENPVSNYNLKLQESLQIYDQRQKELLKSTQELSLNLEKELKQSLQKIILISIISNLIIIIYFIVQNYLYKKNRNKKEKLTNSFKNSGDVNSNNKQDHSNKDLFKEDNQEIFLDNVSKEILIYIENKNQQNKQPTIKEIKKKFNLTHPTILSKLKNLEKNELIYFKKNGREKYIIIQNK